MLNRRQFAASGLASIAMAGLASRAAGQSAPGYRSEVTGYGPLIGDPRGFLDLPRGFTYQLISAAGEAMDDGFVVPSHFDGMACLPLSGRRIALVRNHELHPDAFDRGPTRGQADLERRLAAGGAFDRAPDGRVLPGGTTTVEVDLGTGRKVREWLSLAGTTVNCAGGPTPWNSWLSCEESTVAEGRVGRAHGWVFDVPAARTALTEPRPLTGLGRFRHEAAAVDPDSGIVYLTEDREDGLFYRFVPARAGDLLSPGKLQALALADLAGADTRNWNVAVIQPGQRLPVRWIDMEEVEAPQDDLRSRGHAKGAAIFARGEGIWRGNGEYFFTCTSGGARRHGQIFRYQPSGADGGRLELFVESRDPALMDYADNLTVAPNGHLILCEDRTGGKTNHLRGVTPDGRLYTLARLEADTELAGACFSPDGSVLFCNAYHPGRTLAIRGPWTAFEGTPTEA